MQKTKYTQCPCGCDVFYVSVTDKNTTVGICARCMEETRFQVGSSLEITRVKEVEQKCWYKGATDIKKPEICNGLHCILEITNEMPMYVRKRCPFSGIIWILAGPFDDKNKALKKLEEVYREES